MIDSAWRSHLDLRLYGKGRWITLAPLLYQSSVYGSVVSVPTDFITDLASVPRRPFAYMLTGGRAPAPAVIHDYLYQSPTWDDRELADLILQEAMGVAEPTLGHYAEPPAFRWMMFKAVRWFGWHAWRNHRRRSELNPLWTRDGQWPEMP